MNASNSRRSERSGSYDFIPPEQAPVRRGNARPPVRTQDFVDADFEVIRVPLAGYYRIVNDNRARAGKSNRPSRSAALVTAAVNFIERQLRDLSPRGFATLVASAFLLVFGAVWINAGSVAAPSSENTGPVAISAVQTSIADSNGLRIIEISGIARNSMEHAIAAPRMVARLSPAAGSGSPTFFKLPVPVLAAGESVAFSIRLPHPGGKLPEVSIAADAASP